MKRRSLNLWNFLTDSIILNWHKISIHDLEIYLWSIDSVFCLLGTENETEKN